MRQTLNVPLPPWTIGQPCTSHQYHCRRRRYIISSKRIVCILGGIGRAGTTGSSMAPRAEEATKASPKRGCRRRRTMPWKRDCDRERGLQGPYPSKTTASVYEITSMQTRACGTCSRAQSQQARARSRWRKRERRVRTPTSGSRGQSQGANSCAHILMPQNSSSRGGLVEAKRSILHSRAFAESTQTPETAARASATRICMCPHADCGIPLLNILGHT
jgi:hypothetical protein